MDEYEYMRYLQAENFTNHNRLPFLYQDNMNISSRSTFRWNVSVHQQNENGRAVTSQTASSEIPSRARGLLRTLPTSTFRVNLNTSNSEAENISSPMHRFSLERNPNSRNPVVPVCQLPSSPSRGKPECEICLGDYEDGDLLRHLPCGHAFHAKCIDQWLNAAENCPKCRSNVVKAFRRLKVQYDAGERRRAASTSGSSNDPIELAPTQAIHPASFSIQEARARSTSPSIVSLEPTNNRASILRRLQASARHLQNIRNTMATRLEESRGLYTEIEPTQNRASILRRLHGEQRRNRERRDPEMESFGDIWGGWENPTFALTFNSPAESSFVSTAPTMIQVGLAVNNSTNARRSAVEAAMRRLQIRNNAN